MCCYLLCFVGASVIDWGRCHINYSNVMIGFLIGNTLWQMRNPRRRQLSQIWGFHIIYFTIKILHLQMIVNWVRNERCSSRNLFSLLFNSSPYETEMASINILWTLLNIVCFFFLFTCWFGLIIPCLLLVVQQHQRYWENITYEMFPISIFWHSILIIAIYLKDINTNYLYW